MTDNSQIGFDFDAAELTHDERLILSLISSGRENARKNDSIAAASGLHWRRVQMIIKHLIEDHNYFIGSSVGNPAGYYMITDEAEINEVYQSLRHRGISTLFRAARLKKISVEAVFNQGVLEVKG
jgi:predicted transcriptional regulator